MNVNAGARRRGLRHRRNIGLAGLFLALTAAVPARAAWDVSLDMDPLTDEKTGYMSVENDGGSVALAVKCWNDAAATRWFVVIFDTDFDKAASGPEEAALMLRVDRGVPAKYTLTKVNLNGRLGYGLDQDAKAEFRALENQVLAGRKSIAIEILRVQHVFDVTNGAEALGQMRGACPRLP